MSISSNVMNFAQLLPIAKAFQETRDNLEDSTLTSCFILSTFFESPAIQFKKAHATVHASRVTSEASLCFLRQIQHQPTIASYPWQWLRLAA
ncbi:hypothetical protein GQ607_010571 [Colletotrichum asianum]|uniref:Uncharacterized protein n=1 Tax=Colletotrichum asianum TaxID=702518 RepID=A0A8H3ZNT7_9PEZI|nr:hypothetical protein GQ607_010571 [Colletotrichum asianum]